MAGDDETLKRTLRYVFGEDSQEERRATAAWLGADPEREHLARELTALRDAAPATIGDSERYDVDRARRVLATRRRAPSNVRPAAPIRGRRISWVAGGVAAVAFAAMSIVAIRGRWLNTERVPQERVYTTASGDLQSVTLPDGTGLTLGPESRLVVAADYGRSSRDLTLEGEAYFRVKHDARHPLSVRTSWGVARDVGTAYSVRAYGDDRAMQVVVAQGQVEVAPLDVRPGSGPVIGAGAAASVDQTGRVVVRPDVNVSRAIAWVQGGLAFDDAPLTTVIREVARTFNLTITLADSTLRHEAVTASFGHEPVDNVLDAITQSIGATYQRVGHQVTIRRRATIGHRSPPNSTRLSILTERGTE